MKLAGSFFKIVIPLTSMSDIAFILLIFVIVISLSGAAQSTITLLPRSDTGTMINQKADQVTVIITDEWQTIDGTPLQVNGVEPAEIINTLDNKLPVHIYCQEDVPCSRVTTLLDLFEKRGFSTFRFAVRSS
jgi:biopolymer transport protein ExbD